MKQNLTLTLESELLRSARKLALDRDTSVNQLVREYLVKLVDETDRQEKARAGFHDAVRKSRYQLGPKTWKREDLYDRSL